MNKYNGVKIEAKNERDESPHSKATVKCYVLNPVAEEVTQQTDPVVCFEQLCCEEKIVSSSPKGKGFWQFLFGGKKCKNTKNKCDCNCCKAKTKKKMKSKKVQSNIEIKEMCEEEKQLDCNLNGTTKEIQTPGNCLAKLSHPLAQRGCGCHLYFCIDKKSNKNRMKNKRAINKKNEKIKYNSKYMANCLGKNSFQKGTPKVTILCEEPLKNMELNQDSQESFLKKHTPKPKPSAYDHYKIENKLSSFIPPSPKYIIQREEQTNPLSNLKNSNSNAQDLCSINEPQSKNFSIGKSIVHDHKIKNSLSRNSLHSTRSIHFTQGVEQSYRVNNVGNDNAFTHLQNENDSQIEKNNETNSFIKKGDSMHNNNHLDYKIKEDSSIKEDSIPCEKKHYYDNDKTKDEKNENDKSEGRDNLNSDNQQKINFLTDTKVYSAFRPGQGTVPIMSNYHNEDNNHTHKNVTIRSDRSTDDVNLKEDDLYSQTGKKKPARGSFVRNSMINFRRSRRHSQLESGVSLILTKLDEIEEKMLELEKKYGGKENITMTLTGDHKESNVSIEFYKGKDKEKSKELNLAPKSTQTKPHDFILERDSQGAKPNSARRTTYKSQKEINTTHKINISNIDHAVPANHILHTDENSIKINSKPFKCINPKIIIEYPTKPQPSKTPIICDKWRRISEELKISQPNVSVCTKCYRRKCCCKKCLV